MRRRERATCPQTAWVVSTPLVKRTDAMAATFSSEPPQFGAWALKLDNFLEGVLSGMKGDEAQNQDAVIMDVAPVSGFLEGGRRTSRRRQTVVRSTRSAVRRSGTRPLATHSRMRWLGSSESVDETIRNTGSRRETQHHVAALAVKIFRTQRAEQRDSEVGRESADLREGDPRCCFPMTSRAASSLRWQTGPLKKHCLLNTTKLRDCDGTRRNPVLHGDTTELGASGHGCCHIREGQTRQRVRFQRY